MISCFDMKLSVGLKNFRDCKDLSNWQLKDEAKEVGVAPGFRSKATCPCRAQKGCMCYISVLCVKGDLQDEVTKLRHLCVQLQKNDRGEQGALSR